ncbi:sodium/hydrogen exchanger [Salinisphaera sp. PC39]|uniref:cation:proton antiporter n=1 Tax=Salinisphaera sp. PC39 TaxID=1304156 RepID=UPI003342023C
MTEVANLHALMVLLVGLTIVLAPLIKALFRRVGVPALVGFLLLGFLLRLADTRWHLLRDDVQPAFDLLANLGLVALLFHVGLRSDLRGLIEKLPTASLVWIGDVIASAALGFAAAHALLGLDLIAALVIAAAMTATSVGVSVSVWEDAGLLGSERGKLLIDVAELDDISGVALMALLFAVMPVLAGGGGDLAGPLASAAGAFALKLIGFLAFCYLFTRYLEPRITAWARRLEPAPGRMLTVAGLGFCIAALAGWLGFSLAVGALFAGLLFSRDPEAVRSEAGFDKLYEFFTPFFFIGIGMAIEPGALTAGLGLGAVLFVAAAAGKLLGAGGVAALLDGRGAGPALGVSMIPRAEIAMVIVHQAQLLGPAIVPDAVYAGMVVVSALTCTAAPLVLRPILERERTQSPKG